MVTKQDLICGFRELGLKAGIHIMVHSSLSRFGRVEGGADAVLDALTEIITPEGTLVFPSFNHNAIYDQGGVFDLRSTPTTNGIIPDTFWRREGVIRSVNPTHAFAAWGKNAHKYLDNHEFVPAMGKGSPLQLLMEDGGFCLLLGIDYRANTFHHCVETVTGAPCLSPAGEAYPMILADGTPKIVRTWGWRSKGCPITDAARYAPKMAAIHRQTKIGDATVTMYPLKEGFDIIARCLAEGLDGFPACKDCDNHPRRCRYTVED